MDSYCSTMELHGSTLLRHTQLYKLTCKHFTNGMYMRAHTHTHSTLTHTHTHRLCLHENESRSKSCFGSRSKTWLGLGFELRAFTCIVNAFPITIRICALRGNILLQLSARWLTHSRTWLQRSFFKCTHTNHVPKELCVHILESGFLPGLRSKTPFFFTFQNVFQELDLKQLCVHKG